MSDPISTEVTIDSDVPPDIEISDNPLPNVNLDIDSEKVLQTEKVQELQSQLQLNIRKSSETEYNIVNCRTKGDFARLNPVRIQTHRETFNVLKRLVYAIHHKTLDEQLPSDPKFPNTFPEVVSALRNILAKKKEATAHLDRILKLEAFKFGKTVEFWNKLLSVFQSEIFNRHGELLNENKNLATEIFALNEKIQLQRGSYTIAFNDPVTEGESLDLALNQIKQLETDKHTLEQKLKEEKQHLINLLEENETQIKEAHDREENLKRDLNILRKQLVEPSFADTRNDSLIKTQLDQANDQIAQLNKQLEKNRRFLKEHDELNNNLKTELLTVTDLRDEIQKENQKLQKLLEIKVDRITSLSCQNSNLEGQLENLGKKIDDLQNHIVYLNSLGQQFSEKEKKYKNR